MNLPVQGVDNHLMNNSAEQPVRKKVLVVDETNIFIEVEKSVFDRLENFQLLTTACGIEAFQIIEEELPDLIFLNLHMDNMDGVECCRIIKETYGSGIKVIMLTHGSSENDFDRCSESGCDGIIVKPVNPHLLIATTKKYLNTGPTVTTRGDTRHAARLKVKYGVDQQETLTDYTVNLSTGGLFLATSKVLPIDTRFSIEFTLPVRPMPICCSARVAWVNDPQNPSKKDIPPGMGLQFIDIVLSDVDAIREYRSGGRLLASW